MFSISPVSAGATGRWCTPTEVGDIWGIGRQYAKKLNRNGVMTALDLARRPDGSEDQNAAIAVLDIGWMHDGVHQQAYRVDKDVALLTFDLLTRIVARRIDAGPPFSEPFTL